MYYGEDALSSVYVWDIDNGFAAAILIKKMIIGENCGAWDAINIMEVLQIPVALPLLVQIIRLSYGDRLEKYNFHY